MRALFVPDDRPDVGNGHLVRCGALRAELVSRGWECDWEPLTDQRAWYRRSGTPDVAIMDMQWQAGGAYHCGPVPTVIIIDTPRPAVDVLSDRKSGVALLVCGSAGATDEMFNGFNADKLLVGPQYSLLRPEFAAASIADRSALTGVVDIRRMDVRRILLLEARTLAAMLASSAVCITYGGMRAMEAACVGAPMVVLPRNGGEKLNANGLSAVGAAVVATDEDALKIADRLQGQPEKLKSMSEAGRTLVDGLGVKRVADAIENIR